MQVHLAASSNPLPLVFLSGNATTPSTAKAMLQGAVDFVTKCAPDGDLLKAVGNAMLLDGCRYTCRRALAEIQLITDIRRVAVAGR